MARENPAHSSGNVKSPDNPPWIGVPYRSINEEVSGAREKYALYLLAIEQAGAKPVEFSLQLPLAELKAKASEIDAIVLPGSGADIDPGRYRAARHPKANPADPQRENTDFALLEHAIAEGKPVLAICYGIQLLNVFCGGSLIQDIPSEVGTSIRHPWDRSAGAPEPFHPVRLEAGSRLRELAGADEARVNSSHHQAIRKLGKNLRVVAWANDGIVEAVEWASGDAAWITGVQWHPERMVDDALAKALFCGVVEAARLRNQTVGSRGR